MYNIKIDGADAPRKITSQDIRDMIKIFNDQAVPVHMIPSPEELILSYFGDNELGHIKLSEYRDFVKSQQG